MKAVILAGGLGTRLSEETTQKPKPMVEIGGRPILWNIMKIFSAQGINDFVICCGYKGYVIKEYFANYLLHVSDVTFDIPNNRMQIHENSADPWRVTLVDTGETSGTGGRLLGVRKYLEDESFFMTYGDGVANVDVAKLLSFHKEQGTKATLTAVQPPGRFGAFRRRPPTYRDGRSGTENSPALVRCDTTAHASDPAFCDAFSTARRFTLWDTRAPDT